MQNMVTGVSEGFEVKLEITGVGYRAQANPRSISLSLGFSHPVELDIPDGITVETPSQTQVRGQGRGQAEGRADGSRHSQLPAARAVQGERRTLR